ncbi:MAG: hypothetical protein ACQEVA_17710 [Myxococcota bacterium]
MSVRKFWLVVLLSVACGTGVFFSSSPAAASGPQGNNFGLGVSLGNPTSLTGKYYFSESTFLDFHLGAYRLYDRRYYGDALFLAADYVWEVYNFHEGSTVSIPFYIGAGGGLILDADNDCDVVRNGRCVDVDRNDYFDFAIGPRMPIGAGFQFQEAPFELFVEFSPALYFVTYDDGYREDADIVFGVFNFAIGGRFFFGG